MATQREREILNMIRHNPMISQKELAEKLGITRPGVASHISHLIKEGLITGKGYILPDEDHVTVIGAVNMDVFGVLTQDEVQSKVSNSGIITSQIGGMGRNIAVNLTSLGIETNLITAFGSDAYGEVFKNDALKHSVNINYAQQYNDLPTSVYMYVDRKDGERIIGVDNMTINQQITPDFLQQRLPSINGSQLVIFDTNLPANSIEWLYNNVDVPLIAKAVSVNKVNRLFASTPQLDMLVINGIEASLITGKKIENAEVAREVAKVLYQKVNAPVWLYVDELGITFYDGQDSYYQTFSNLVGQNLNGVGTSIVAAVAYARINEIQPKDAIKIAVDAAVLTSKTQDNISNEIRKIIY